MTTIEQKATQQIASAGDILAICHIAPDGDAIGSLLGLGLALQQKGCQVTMACADPVPDSYHHLPHWEMITRSPRGSFDLVICLDCSDLDRLGKAYDPQALAHVPIINIDHHATNVDFGEINWVDVQAAATAQILVRLIHALDVPLNPEIATCLLHGILTDTLGFRTLNANVEVLKTAIELIKAGASLAQLTDQIFNHRPIAVVRMWAEAMRGMHLEGQVLWTQITRDMRRRIGYEQDGDAGLVSFLNTVSEANIAIVFDELSDGRINVSMRAARGYDVSQVALALGGGGHPQAAGCTISGPLEDARNKVLSMLQRVWDAQTEHE